MDPSPSLRPPSLSDPELLRLLTDSLKACGSGRIHLRGDSMRPTLQDGWKLHIRSLPAEELRVGDIAIFVHRELLTIHRLIWKRMDGKREMFIFQGDNNAHRETVEAGAILGRVEAAEGEWCQQGVPNPLPVGNDSRALFYRNTYRLHTLATRLVPSTALPGEAESGKRPYRFLRALFHLVEPIFSPRRRR